MVGEVTVGGFPKNQQTFARVSGYCEQTDVHSPLVSSMALSGCCLAQCNKCRPLTSVHMQTTVHEALIFCAALRLTGVTDKARLEAFVDEVCPASGH